MGACGIALLNKSSARVRLDRPFLKMFSYSFERLSSFNSALSPRMRANFLSPR